MSLLHAPAGARGSVVSTLAVLVSLVPQPALAAPIASAPPGTGVGVLETVAGPGFCNGGARIDPESGAVGALGVDQEGRIFVDSGRPELGLVRATDGLRSTILRTGAPRSGERTAPVGVPGPPGASRLTPDGAGGVVLAVGAKVIAVTGDLAGHGPGPRAHRSVETLAGDPATAPGALGPMASGDGGPAVDARFRSTRSIAGDERHNLFVADVIDPEVETIRIRFINRSNEPVTFYAGTPQELVVAPGNIDTVAGVPGAANTGDGQPARAATVAGVPPSMAVAGGKLYIALLSHSDNDHRSQSSIRMVNLGAQPVVAHGVTAAPGHIETVARRESLGSSGAIGADSSEQFSYLPGIAAGADGSVYLADQDHHRIRRLDPGGRITTFAGTGAAALGAGGFGGNGQAAVDARLDGPADVKVGPTGDVFIADAGNAQLRVVDAGGRIQVAPGNWQSPTCATVDEVTRAGRPSQVDADAIGTLYFVNQATQRVMTRAQDGTVSPLTGPAPESAPITATAVAVRPGGGLYMVGADRSTVLFANVGTKPLRLHGVTVGPQRIEKVAGGQAAPVVASSGDRPSGSALLPADDLAVDDRGNLFIAEAAARRVRQVDPDGHISSVAGEGAGSGRDQCCRSPVALAVSSDGNLYISDRAGAQVWLVNRDAAPLAAHGQLVAPGAALAVAGTGQAAVGGDEGGEAVRTPLAGPRGIAVDDLGNLYVADEGDHAVRRVDAGGTLTTVAGTGQAGFNGDGLAGARSHLDSPVDVAVDPCGDLVIADSRNDRLRRLRQDRSCEPGTPDAERGSASGASWWRSLRWLAPSAVIVAAGAYGLLVAGRRRRRAIKG